MATGTRLGIVAAEFRFVEQHPAQFYPFPGERIIAWKIGCRQIPIAEGIGRIGKFGGRFLFFFATAVHRKQSAAEEQDEEDVVFHGLKF